MPEDDPHDREEELREMLRRMLGGDSDIDPAKLAEAAGVSADPAMMQQLMAQLQGAIRANGDHVNWSMALEAARTQAQRSVVVTLPEERATLEGAIGVAGLWLGEATAFGELPEPARLMSRTEWVTETMPVWSQLAEPVVTSIADALQEVLREQAGDAFDGGAMDASALGLGAFGLGEGQDAGSIIRGIGNTLFAMQLGAVVGQLSTEVVSGGDVGVPLVATSSGDAYPALLPQNVHGFAAGLDIPLDQVQLYLAVRELAHARLFHHARWLRLQVLATIGEAAHGVGIDMSSLEDAVVDFDPSNPESLREALVSGDFIRRENDASLARLETTLALVEGWVDVVTAQATARLPKSDAIAETVRRRRATGGPAESAFASLVGLELRPRRLREAAAMWQRLTDAAGVEARDALWAHPDLMPTAEDIDDPAAFIARVTGETPTEPDDIDRALEDLLGDESGDRPTE